MTTNEECMQAMRQSASEFCEFMKAGIKMEEVIVNRIKCPDCKQDEYNVLKVENERLRKALKDGSFYLTKAHEVARMVDIRLNSDNSVNRQDFLNNISESYLFNQSTIVLLEDAKAALSLTVQQKTGCQ